MYQPFDNRVIVRVPKHYILGEDKKPVLADDGTPIYEPEQECTVLSSNIEGIKKGMTIIPIIRGGVPIRLEENKKYSVVIIDREDIYAVKI